MTCFFYFLNFRGKKKASKAKQANFYRFVVSSSVLRKDFDIACFQGKTTDPMLAFQLKSNSFTEIIAIKNKTIQKNTILVTTFII